MKTFVVIAPLASAYGLWPLSLACGIWPLVSAYGLLPLALPLALVVPIFSPVEAASEDFVVTCGESLDVSVTSGKWTYIAVKGHESDSNCVSKHGQSLQFNLFSGGCSDGIKVSRTGFYEGESEIDLIGSQTIHFNNTDGSFKAFCSLPAASGASGGLELRFEEVLQSKSQTIATVQFGAKVLLTLDANMAQFDFETFGIVGCTAYNDIPSSDNVLDFELIDNQGCKVMNNYNPFLNKENLTGFSIAGKTASSAEFSAFKFPNSPFLMVSCSVIFCNTSSAQLCHQVDCQSSHTKQTNESEFLGQEIIHLNVSAVLGIEKTNNDIEKHGKINHLGTTIAPKDACGAKCVILIVVAVFLVIANAAAITVIIKKMIEKKKELKVIDRDKKREKEVDSAWSSDQIQGLEKLSPLSLSASLESASLASSTASSTASSSTASSRVSMTSNSEKEVEVEPRLRSLSPIETPIVKVYNTYI